jgi:hypothetical protein
MVCDQSRELDIQKDSQIQGTNEDLKEVNCETKNVKLKERHATNVIMRSDSL